MLLGDLGVDLGGGDIGMPQEFLDVLERSPTPQHMRAEGTISTLIACGLRRGPVAGPDGPCPTVPETTR